MLCKLCEEVIKDPEGFIRNVDGNRGLLGSIADVLRKIKNSLAITLTNSEKAKLDNAVMAIERYVRGEGGNSSKKYSYGGVRAENAPEGFLRADRLYEFDTDNEAIRRETGWFKGADGKWRFEIDDSKMQVDVAGKLHRNPDIRKNMQLFEDVYINGDTSKLEELQISNKNLKGVKLTPQRLGDMISHPDLFKHYPEIADVGVEFKDLPAGYEGGFVKKEGKIVLNKSLRTDERRLKRTLIHEIQHCIQTIEGFAGGANVRYWEENQRKGNLQIAKRYYEKYQNAKDAFLSKVYHKSAEYAKLCEELETTRWNTSEYNEVMSKIGERLYRDFPEDKAERLLDDVLNWGYEMDVYKGYSSGTKDSPRTLYLETAGEQESRDVESRLDYTLEQRQSIKPFTGDNNTVFVEGVTDSASIDPAFVGDLYEWYNNGRDNTTKFVLGTTSDILQGLGAEEKSIYMQSEKINEILKKHPTMTINIVAQIPRILENPIMILKSQAKRTSSQNTRLVVFSDVKDVNGAPILAVMDLRPVENNLVVESLQKVTSAYAKTNNPKDFVENSDVLYVHENKKRTNRLLRTIGFKMPTELHTVGSIGSIAYNGQNVNITGVPFKNIRVSMNVDNAASFHTDSGNVDISDDLKGLTIRERIDARANSGVTAKSRNVQTKAENTLIKTISNAFGVKYADKQGVIKEMVKDITAQVKATGTVKAEDIDRLVDTAFEKGVISENELVKQYPNLKKELRESRFKYQPGEVFQNVRNNYFGKLLFAKDGTDVDSLYKEYSDKYPGIFPKDIINPEDQIVRFADVYDSLAENEQSLESYYGEQSENMKSLIKEDLQYAVDRYIAEINDVSAFETSKRISDAERQIRQNNKKPLTKEEYKAAQDKAYKAQKTLDKLTKDILLTDEENKLVDTLLAGGAPELVSGKNRDKILAVYAAKKAVQDAQAPIKQYKADIRSKRQEIADSVLTTFRSWTDKKIGLGYSTETMERNIRDIVPDGDEAFRIIDTYITPVHQAEADAVRLKNRMRDRVRALNIDTSTKKEHLYNVSLFGESGTVNLSVNESGLVQLFGEKKITEQQLKDCGADVVKIKNAVSEFRKIYNELYDMADYALVRNGYAPLGKIEDYFPHFLEESDTVLSKLAKRAGFEVQTNKLPTSIAGITETFKPGKKWFANALTRTGDTTVFDAVNGFDQYIEGVSGIIYQTDNIQNLRELENRMRYLAGDKGLREQLDAIDANDSLTVEDKQDKKDRLYKEQKNFNLSNFVTYLRDYTNTIAGKKQIQDRGIEHDLGRGIYTMSKALEGRIASNMIGANIGSALTNFIPIAQASGEIKTKHMLQAMNDTMHAMYGKDNSFEYESDFLTNRFGSDKLVYTWAQNISNKTGVLMTAIDRFTSNVITRARYYQNIENGMERTLAIMDADDFAANVLADRSKGALPLVFERRNPLIKAVTMFQVEQNNQFRYLLKDLPRGLRDKGKGAIFAALLKYAIASFLYNQLYEKLVGRRPAFDPIDICLGIYNDTSEAVKGNIQPSEAMKNISSDILEEVPFVSGLAGGGRIPISSAMPDIAQLLKLADGNVSGDKKKQIAWNELKKPLFYIVPTTAGGQIKKGFETYELFGKNKGVEYSIDNDGNKKVKFTAQPTVGNVVRSAAFGKWSLPEAREYIDAGNKGLTKDETTAFNALVDSGMGYLDVKKMLEDRQRADTDGNSYYTKEEAKAYLDKTGYTREQKAILFACMCPTVKNNPYR